MGLSRRKLYYLPGFVLLILITAYLFAELGAKIASGIRNNITNLAIRSQYISSDGNCEKIDFSKTDWISNLAAMDSSSLSQARWIQIQGYTNRTVLYNDLKSGAIHLSNDTKVAIKLLLSPRPWAMQYGWDAYRCQSAWGSWTLGLIAAVGGDWAQAVAYYQAGIGLAPGNVPHEIVNEYYQALAQARLAGGQDSLEDQLVAGKYYALGGDIEQAKTLFQSLLNKDDLSPGSRCVAEHSLTWLDDLAGPSSADLPPWPVTSSDVASLVAPLQICATDAATDKPGSADWKPDWVLTQDDSNSNGKPGNRLVGFDLDADVLEAGAEVLGVLYWQTSDGAVVGQRFRQPNLWPNSGFSWLDLPGFSGCIPGYGQPSWVPGCASRVIALPGERGEPNMVGELRQPAGLTPDSFLYTASSKLAQDKPVIFGGRFLVDGDFPRGHSALTLSENASEFYQPILDLSRLSPGQWISITRAIQVPADRGAEYSQWLRPRAGVGSGRLLFDDLFGFVLPDIDP